MTTLKRCPTCHKAFTDAKHPNQKYCCQACVPHIDHRPVTCATCGKVFLDKKHPERKYCSTKCNIEAHHKTVVCICGKTFRTTLKKDRKYCSTCCANRGRGQYQHGDPANRITFTCEQCGKPFSAFRSRKRRFCSYACRNEHDRKPESFIALTCAVCGKEYRRHKCFLDGRKSNYCSVQCRAAASSVLKRGVGNPNYKGGAVPYRGANWPSQRRKAMLRDGYTCQICGRKGKPGKRQVDAHHINPYRNYNGDYQAANQLDNLITLCKRCHGKVECGKLSCPKRLL